MDKKIDPREIKWFAPLWRRVALTVGVATWSTFEWIGGDMFWFTLTLITLAFVVWRLFIVFPSAAEIAAFRAAQEKDGSPDGR